MTLAYSGRVQPFIDAFVLGLFDDAGLRRHIFAETRLESAYAETSALRAEQHRARPGTKQPYYSNYRCGKDSRCTCRIEGSRALESDAIVLVENNKGRRCAIHIEVKREGEGFSFGQPEAYRLRAECWASGSYRPDSLPAHQDWLAICTHGQDLAHHQGLASFDKTFTHRDLSQLIPGYPACQ